VESGREKLHTGHGRSVVATASAPPDRAKRPATVDPYAQILELAGEARSKARYFRDVTSLLVRTFESPYGAIHVRMGAEVVQDEFHFGPTNPKFWKDQLQQFLTESLVEGRSQARLLKAKTSNAGVAFLSSPMFDPAGAMIGAIAMVIDVREHADCVSHLATLESLCRLASYCVGVTTNKTAATPVSERGPVRGTGMSMVELAFSLTNELCNKLGCEQVAIGLVKRRRVRVISISGLDHISHRSPGVSTLRAAMEECLDANVIVEYPPNSADEHEAAGPRTLYLHKQWHTATKGSVVTSIPLRVRQSVEAILSIRTRAEGRIPRARLDEIQSKIEPYVPPLLQARRADRGLFRHAAESVSESVRSIGKPGHRSRRFVAGFAAAAALYVFFGTWDYNINAPCVLTPGEIRNVRAPSQGLLAATHVIAGDRVKQGDVLCEFDHRELDQEKAELEAQLEVYARQRDRAMAAAMAADAKLAEAEERLTRARLEIVRRRIDQTSVRSPIDGVVMAGDLRQSVGAVLAKGDALFQVAPDHGWKVEVELPERGAADISGGLRGTFAAFARPEASCEFHVDRVLPTAQMRHNRNVFVAEASIDRTSIPLRAGMEGIGRVRVGRRPIWWLLTHGLTDYLYLHQWL